ncbi:MAG TPA: ThuA domain-containing protein, partial [Chitinophagaceae bacterium]|nr:ThuA domain-containing protein [Chitinophagaceae bacterium]
MRLLKKNKPVQQIISLPASTLLYLFVVYCVITLSCNKRSGKPRVLVFSKQTYYFHTSIPNGIAAIKKLGAENGFEADTTTDAAFFNEDTLKKYAAVIFLHNADNKGTLLNQYQEAEFERYIQSGGGYVGIHAAADAEYNWGWYGRLAG